ncbi:zinc finger CCCH domain-containing protein 53-like isoform X2 [Canna indica]|uniref:Zinc finger CCCH domain-containing protein 53-like isoform X2 n=1 Tax=Canna indica TaxID=4628 RepID=A0AAQ3KA17_9LILI|nr:zinc finger CCCH domain-containing protein 53-like isoform X2 [Canna indica]
MLGAVGSSACTLLEDIARMGTTVASSMGSPITLLPFVRWLRTLRNTAGHCCNSRMKDKAPTQGDDENQTFMSRPWMMERMASPTPVVNPISHRRIFLTFSADNTFTEEDLSYYFRFPIRPDVRVNSLVAVFLLPSKEAKGR